MSRKFYRDSHYPVTNFTETTFSVVPFSFYPFPYSLKRNADLSLNRARRNEMRSAEGRVEIIERDFVGQINECQTRRNLCPIRMKKIIRPETQIKQIARGDARRIRVVVFRAVRRNSHAQRTAISRRAVCQRITQSRKLTAAEKPDLLLLVRAERQSRCIIGNAARNESTVVAIGKSNERRDFMKFSKLVERILHLRRLLKRLIVVNTKRSRRQIRVEK